MDADNANRVRIFLGEREVFNAPLAPMRPSASGKSILLAQDSSKTQSHLPGFDRIGWTFTMYGLLKPVAAKPEGDSEA